MIEHFFPSVSTEEAATKERRDGALIGLVFAGWLVAAMAWRWYSLGDNPKLSPEAVAGARETLTGQLIVPAMFVALSVRLRMAPDRVCAWLFLILVSAGAILWIVQKPDNYAFLFVHIGLVLAGINVVRGAHASKRFNDQQIMRRLF